MNPSHPDHRHNLGAFLNYSGLLGEGCEIGVLHGTFSKMILDSWDGRILHLVDPLIRQSPEVYMEITNDTQDWGANLAAVERLVAASGGRAILHRKLSEDAVMEFTDGQLDWVFIDGNHGYNNIKADLNNWWPKIKCGGLMSGHDYFYDQGEADYLCGVKRAVDEFVSDRGFCIAGVTQCTSFWIWKE